ncbi:hypothetical protein [Haladaptatus sp. NG-WS-4]
MLQRGRQAVEYEVTQAGNVRYRAPASQHDDCVDALALACHEENAENERKRTVQTPFV